MPLFSIDARHKLLFRDHIPRRLVPEDYIAVDQVELHFISDKERAEALAFLQDCAQEARARRGQTPHVQNIKKNPLQEGKKFYFGCHKSPA